MPLTTDKSFCIKYCETSVAEQKQKSPDAVCS